MCFEDLVSCYVMSLYFYWLYWLVDWQFYYQVSSSWVVELEEFDGNCSVVGSGMFCLLGDDYVLLGLVIIIDVLQGCGLGCVMMQCLLQDVGMCNVIFNVIEVGCLFYEKLGFVVIDILSQYQSIIVCVILVLVVGVCICLLCKDEVFYLLVLDCQVSGMDCSVLLVLLLDIFEVVVLEQVGQVKGVVYLCEFGCGCVIGFVIVSYVEDVKMFIVYWINVYFGVYLCIDVLGWIGFKLWFEEIGLICVDNVVSMCCGILFVFVIVWCIYFMINQVLG